MRSACVVALGVLAFGACKKKTVPAVAEDRGVAPERVAPDAAEPPSTSADGVIHQAFAHASAAFSVTKATLHYVHQDGTLDQTYGEARFEFGKHPEKPAPPPDDPRRPIGAPVPEPVENPLGHFERDCPEVTWMHGQLEDKANGGSCAFLMMSELHHPHCTVREVWKRAIARGAPPAALAQLEIVVADNPVDDLRQGWRFTVEDEPRNIHIKEDIADDCQPVVEQPAR